MAKQKILAILFCEFDPVTGPKISCQVPENYISREGFDSIHNYIIPKPELQQRLITVNALNHVIVGCPVVMDNAKYARNALIFNLCFVFDSTTDTSNYEPVVKKLASYLTQLELESELLSSADHKERVLSFLNELMTRLNKDGSCSIYMGESCTVHLKVSPIINDPPTVQDHDVPIFIKENEQSMSTWDLTTQQVLPYIDGFNHVAKIAADADVERNLVKACLQNLLHYDIIKIITVFQYSNVYTTTSHITALMDDAALQCECIRFVARKHRSLPTIRDIFLLYAGLTAGTTVKDLCCRYNPHGMKVNERKLIQFGLLKGIIRRLNKYPVKLPTGSDAHVVDSSNSLFNGVNSYDQICTKTGYSCHTLDDRIENDPNVVVCWK